MTSFIICSTDKEKSSNFINDILNKENIETIDATYLSVDSSKNENSIGIEDIKTFQLKIFLKPIKSKVKAIIIQNAELLTIQAQNALLKILEEPPKDTIIILDTNTTDSLLPTILSRCQITNIQAEQVVIPDDIKIELEEFIANIPNMKIGDKLKKAEELAKDKNQALLWIEKLILVLRDKMLFEKENSDIVENIKTLQKLHTILKTTNANPRLAIETTLLSL